MPGSRQAAPRPRNHARAPGYPALLGLAAALTACSPQSSLRGSRGIDRSPHAATPEDSRTVLVLAADPGRGPDTRYRVPPPEFPREDGLELIEDPAAFQQTVPCGGDCPAAFSRGGPRADIRFRVDAGNVPDARSVLSIVQATLHACVAQRNTNASWIQIRAAVSPEGRMQPIEVRSDANADSDLVSCVANATLGSRFARTWHAASILVIVDVAPG